MATPFGNNVVTIGDDMWIIYRAIRESQFRRPDFDLIRRYFRCDKVFRKDGMIYFCRLIPSIDYKEL